VTAWLTDPTVLAIAFVASLVVFVLGLLLVPIVVARLPADYFASDRVAPEPRHRALRWVFRIAKNLLGAALVLAGIAMLVLPGQGVLTIVAGLSLLEFPGKRRLELRLLRTKAIRRVIDRMRERAGRPPLQL
jgi:hypothetical protein